MGLECGLQTYSAHVELREAIIINNHNPRSQREEVDVARIDLLTNHLKQTWKTINLSERRKETRKKR